MNPSTLTTAAALVVASILHGAPSQEETAAIAELTAKGFEISKNDAGHAVRLMSKSGDGLGAADYAPIGRLSHLEQMGLNGAKLADGDWAFLKSLPRLKQISIWHGHGFATLEPFSGLPVESLTIGGCMGLRDKNQGDAAKLRNVITTLHDLPNLKKGNWYHSPLAPDDSHLAHIAAQFPKLEDLRLDFAAPRGSQTSITPAGLAALQKLPLQTLSLENAHTFTTAHFDAIAGIRSLRTLLVDARRSPTPAEGIASFKTRRPDVQVVVADKDASGPPVPPRPRK